MRASRIAKEELLRLKDISMNSNPSPWHQTINQNHRKIASLNCAGLLPHLKDLKVDPKLMQADTLALQEISLAEDHVIPLFSGFTMQVAGRGRGKGVATLQKDGGNWEEIGKSESKMQILKSTSKNLDVINVYRSSNKSLVEAADGIAEMVDAKNPTIIIGDFNVCVKKNYNNVITKRLENLGFHQLVQEATHIEGNVIDHVYWKNVNSIWEHPLIEHYSPYFSDHDSQLITLKLVRQEMLFDH